MSLVVGAFLVFFALVVSGGLLLFYRDLTAKRLASVVSQRPSAFAKPASLRRMDARAAVETIVTPFQKVLPRNEQDTSAAQKRLIWAGSAPT